MAECGNGVQVCSLVLRCGNEEKWEHTVGQGGDDRQIDTCNMFSLNLIQTKHECYDFLLKVCFANVGQED